MHKMETLRKAAQPLTQPRELLNQLTGSRANAAGAAGSADVKGAPASAVPQPRRAAPSDRPVGHPELSEYIKARAAKGEVRGLGSAACSLT